MSEQSCFLVRRLCLIHFGKNVCALHIIERPASGGIRFNAALDVLHTIEKPASGGSRFVAVLGTLHFIERQGGAGICLQIFVYDEAMMKRYGCDEWTAKMGHDILRPSTTGFHRPAFQETRIQGFRKREFELNCLCFISLSRCF